MKKIGAIVSFILSVSIVVFAASKSYSETSIIAKFDNKQVTKTMLESYVKDLSLDEKYQQMLTTDEGLKQLADFYITRVLLLDFADKNEYKDSNFVKQHMMSEHQNSETIIIAAVLKKEINDKIVVLPEEIDQLLAENNTTDRKAAYFALQSIKRQEMYKAFITDLKSQHDIEYMLN